MFQSGNYRLVAPINWEVQNDIKLHQNVLEKKGSFGETIELNIKKMQRVSERPLFMVYN